MNTQAAGEGVDAETRERVTSTLAALPYARHLGIRAAEVDGAGAVVLHLPFEARFSGAPERLKRPAPDRFQGR